MAERRKERAPRGYVAQRLDEVTLALFVALLIVLVGAVMQLGPDEVLGRVGSGLSGTVNAFLACWQSCR